MAKHYWSNERAMKNFFDNAWCAKHCVEINDVLHVAIQANAPLPQTIKL